MAGHDHHHDKHATHLALVQRLRWQAADIRRLITGVEDSALTARTAPGRWSPKELLCHFRRMESVFGDRFQQMLSQDNAVITPYNNPDDDDAFLELTRRPTQEVLSEYLTDREALCRRLEMLSPADWHRKGIHPEFPHFDVHFQVEYMAHHEAHHIYQLFQRRVPLGKLPH